MKSSSFHPVLMTTDVPGTAAFYTRHFGFRALFTSDWYVHLQAPDNPAQNLAILDGQHPTIPPMARGSAQGVILNFEVADTDAEHARLTAAGLAVVQPLRNEDFGQRHFIIADPNGVLIDIITPIPPTAEFAAQYDPAALPVG